MPPVAIENPILNSPYAEQQRQFRFDDHKVVTADILPGRRPSEYFTPIAAPKKKSKQLAFDCGLEAEKALEADEVNRVRACVKK